MAHLKLRDVGREYPSGEGVVCALSHLDLVIEAGESVAIMGASGSGKSTLLNILGFLDRPTSGTYELDGIDTSTLSPASLAALRRDRFGFIFQRYNLLSDWSALGNVEIPGIYAGHDSKHRRTRAEALLKELGLESRASHRPAQLSGGQQQRVAIARALMNGGEIILADEPTGALDSHAGEEVLRLLLQLHAAGRTLIIVTHDPAVAARAARVVELHDGKVISDRKRPTAEAPIDTARRAHVPATLPPKAPPRIGGQLLELVRMAAVAMNAHRLRAALTMLGIVIGIASLVLVVALGTGARERVLREIAALGTNTIDIQPGQYPGDLQGGRIHTLVAEDADALLAQGYIDSVTPYVITEQKLRSGNLTLTSSVTGVGEQYFRVHGMTFVEGRSFVAADSNHLTQVAIIDERAKAQLFGAASSAVGRVIILGSVPVRIVGVVTKPGPFSGSSAHANVWIPYTTALRRILGQRHLHGLTARVSDNAAMDLAAEGIEQVLTRRHGRKDFALSNSDSIRQAMKTTATALTNLIASIALISLVVGGIGVMNIMLVSVTERTREIGVRTALGAREQDILLQFLIEAVLLCLAAGAAGAAFAFGIGWLISEQMPQFPLIFSAPAFALAIGVSTVTGLVFGYLPARSAARLDPVAALARE